MVRGKKCPVCGRYHIFKHKTVTCEEHAKNLGYSYHAPDVRKNSVLDNSNTNTARSAEITAESSQTNAEQPQPENYTLPPADDVLQDNLAGSDIFHESEDNQPDSKPAPSSEVDDKEVFKIGIGSRENIMLIKWVVKELAEVEVKDSDFDSQDVADLDRAYQKAGLAKEVSDPKYYILWFNVKYAGLPLMTNIKTVIKNIKSKLAVLKDMMGGGLKSLFGGETNADVGTGPNGDRKDIQSK